VYSPPELVRYDVPRPDPARARRLALPGAVPTAGPGGPVWEDATHVLIPALNGAYQLTRMDVETGATEAAPLTPAGHYRPIIVEPLWTD
jgi:hypothetical protein